MKTFIKTIITIAFAFIIFFAGSFAVDAASVGQFDPDPAGNGTGFFSIKTGNSCSGCANQQNSLSLNIPNPGNTQRFTLYTDFRNMGNSTIYNAEGLVNISSSNGTLSGTLSGSGASSITDNVYLNNLPSNFEIDFINGYVENTHGDTDPTYCSGYNHYDTLNENEVLNSGAPLGHLDTVENGWCDQGYFIATFEIENTGINPVNLDVSTLNPSDITSSSARLNGFLNSGDDATVWFVYGTNNNLNCNTSSQVSISGTFSSNQFFNKIKSGLLSNTTYYYRACAEQGTQSDSGTVKQFTTGQNAPNVEVTTLNPTNVTTSSAKLNGRLDSGENVNVSFHYSTSLNISCSNGTIANGPNSLDAVSNFDKSIYSLNSNTTYYYVACGENSTGSDEGDRKQFTTGQDPINLSVQTRNAENITITSASLEGRLLEGNNAEVWFVINISTNVNCGISSQRVDVSGNPYDGGDYFDVIKTGLEPDTHYYYKACAEQGTQGATGELKDFYTQEIVNDTYHWDVGEYGECINGIEYRTVVCRDSDGNIVFNEQLCIDDDGPKPPTQQSCTVDEHLLVSTDDVSDLTVYNGGLNAKATANGDVFSGTTNYVYFVFAQDNINVSCFDGLNQQVAEDHTLLRTAGDDFEWTFAGLYIDTDYHYRACGIDNLDGSTSQGQIESFTTPNIDSNNEPDVDTNSPQDVDEDSAELRGDVDMNDFNDGIVFFVYGQDEDRIEDVEDDYETFEDVEDDEDNDEFEVKLADSNFDGNDDFEEHVTNLDEDERYYYQICVEFENDEGDDEIKCGGVEDFDTDDDDDDNNNDVEIETLLPRNVTQTTAEMCGDLIEDDGDAQQTWIEFRRSNESGYNLTPIRQRSEGSFCERVSGLQSNTTYYYKACTPDDCDSTRSFRTLGINIPTGQDPIIITNNPTNIRNNSATLNGIYVANAPAGSCWFDYGRTSSLGRSTQTYNVTGYGACTHSFTQLSSNTQYCVQAVIQTMYGTDRGSVRCFNTPGGGGPARPPVIVIEDDDDVDLSILGLGLSLVRLSIDDDEEVLVRGENVEYVVEWENVSELDLTELDLKVVMPPEIEVTDISRGRFDKDENTIYFTIDDLYGIDAENNVPGERGDMTISGIVGRGVIGNLVTAEAELSYDNPINRAKEDAVDWDVDGYGIQVAGVTASVFGLADITFLGWLVILLGLFIIFLVARWLYLEREEMRAQAYGGYAPAYGHAQPQMPVYREQPQQYAQPHYEMPPVAPPVPEAPRNDHYEPYRPNRG